MGPCLTKPRADRSQQRPRPVPGHSVGVACIVSLRQTGHEVNQALIPGPVALPTRTPRSGSSGAPNLPPPRQQDSSRSSGPPPRSGSSGAPDLPPPRQQAPSSSSGPPSLERLSLSQRRSPPSSLAPWVVSYPSAVRSSSAALPRHPKRCRCLRCQPELYQHDGSSRKMEFWRTPCVEGCLCKACPGPRGKDGVEGRRRPSIPPRSAGPSTFSLPRHPEGCRCKTCQPNLYQEDGPGRELILWDTPCLEGCQCEACNLQKRLSRM